MSQADKFAIEKRAGITVVRLDPEYASVYEGELPELAGILDLAVSVAPARLVLDLSGTQYFGSAFIGFLMAVSMRLNCRPGGRFGISGASGFAQVALATTKSDQLIENFESVGRAVAAFQ